ncbi:MAG TPA: TonB-dependent siderophore receptor [Verrucomicrobiae bacterium]
MMTQKNTVQGQKPGYRPSASTLMMVNAIMLAGASAAQAQTNTPPVAAGSSTNAPTKLPDVVITGEKTKDETAYKPETVSSPKYTEPLVNTTQSITVIPRAVMEDQGATSLRDVLRNVPGISMQAGEGGVPAGDNLSIRGFNARTDMFIDGVRDFGGYSRDPFNMEQVEVIKGPTSSSTGRGSTGGSINLVSKMPKVDPFYSGSVGVGTDNYIRSTVDVNQPLKDTGFEGTALRLNGVWHQNDTPRRDEVTNERWGVAPSLAFGLGTPTRVTLSYFHLEQDNIPDYGIPFVPVGNTDPFLAGYGDQVAPVDYSNFYGLANRDYEKTRTDLGTALFEHDFNDSYSLRNLFRMGITKRDSIITAPRFFDSDPGAGVINDTRVNRQIQSRDQTDTIIANQTDLTSRFETAKLEHTLVTSLEVIGESSENYTRAGVTSVTDIYNPNPNDPNPGAVTRTGVVTEAQSMSAALSIFDTIKIGEKWQVNGGVRFEHFEVDVGPLRSNDDMISGRTGLVFKPKENGSVYFGYGTSFNPSAEGLTLATTATAANNVNTDPEQSHTYELGTKWEFFKQRLSISAAVFRTDKTNARTEDPTNPADVIVLNGVQRVDGIEFGAAGRITEEWQVFAGYTYMHSEIVKSLNAAEVGKELSNTPEQSFNLWTTYQLPFGLELGGGAQFVDTRYSSNTNTRQVEGYVLFDAMVGYRINKNFDVRLNVYNLTDTTYIDRVGGGHVIPGAGRSAVLTANFRF